MRDQTETLNFFKKAIDLAVVEIEHRMKKLTERADRELQTLATLARSVGLKVPTLSPKAERLASQLTWAPIAERFLVALMEPLVQKSVQTPKYPREMCRDLWKSTLPSLARETGLSLVDAPVVRSAVEWVLFDSDLLEKGVRLDWNRHYYFVRREGDYLIVDDQEVSAADPYPEHISATVEEDWQRRVRRGQAQSQRTLGSGA